MQHASDTNRKDRAQKEARRETFNGNHSDKSTLGKKQTTKLDFSHLSEEQIAAERARIQSATKQRKQQTTGVLIMIFGSILVGVIWLYTLLK